MDIFVAESVMCGGWCVYVQAGREEYEVVLGPFQSREDAQSALDDWIEQADLDEEDAPRPESEDDPEA